MKQNIYHYGNKDKATVEDYIKSEHIQNLFTKLYYNYWSIMFYGTTSNWKPTRHYIDNQSNTYDQSYLETILDRDNIKCKVYQVSVH